MNQIEIGLQAYQIETWGVSCKMLTPFCFLLDFVRANINRTFRCLTLQGHRTEYGEAFTAADERGAIEAHK